MLPPVERPTKPFGTRRPAAFDAAPGATPEPRAGGAARPAGSLAWALRISGLVGLLALVATHQLARLGQTIPAPTQLALGGRGVPADPETTGSITAAGAARATHLDPCLLPALDRPHP
ncbi:hypothetical protein WYO_4325 [Methylobacterium sp. GXF4]|jgi:streptogramin lyase|uniref:Uncharacterized protein n=1 Tax=Methylobacterium brachiatum TaxID=269660 RepID=A0ABV1R615_9HYPH|nr:hypothetical protein [Methylobacterium sp. GXF4]EIZ83032.1 hypothetical protein WYO_4325 [Methylobacterium sp. GXF4]